MKMRHGMLAAGLLTLLPQVAIGQGFALRFYGHGVNDIDRVKIAIDDPAKPVDVGGDFTLEWWMKASLSDNPTDECTSGGDAWIFGNIMFDRDVFGSGDFGDFGISLYGGRIAFGVDRLGTGNSVCTESSAATGSWRHVAVTRAASGTLRVFIDGLLDAEDTGPMGDISYRDDRPTSYPNSDPFLVIGAEKHDAGASYPSYNGLIDEVRLSDVIRYTANFTPPSAPFSPDADTIALYHFDEGPAGPCTGTVSDSSGTPGGPSSGACEHGGASPSGPIYVGDVPFNTGPTPTPTATPTPLCANTPISSGCRTPGKSVVLVKDDEDGDHKLLWKWLKGGATDAVDFALPTSVTTYSLCIYDSIGGNAGLAMSATVPPGGPWNAAGNGFSYKDPGGAAGGITKVTLKSGAVGKAKIIVKGKGAGLNLPPPASLSTLFSQDPLLIVQLVNSDGTCWEGTFSAEAVKNSVDQFKDTVP